MDYFNMNALCGLDCFNCPLYRAGQDEALRQALARKLHLTSEQAQYRGCRNEGGTIPFLGMTEPCQVYRCTRGKALDFCCHCEEFPCDHLHPYADRASEVPHNTKVFNLCLIRKLGLERWAGEKAARVKDTYFRACWKI